MKPDVTLQESGQPPKFEGGERGGCENRHRLSPCDDPPPCVSPSGSVDLERHGAGRGMGPQERRGSMNGNSHKDKQICGIGQRPRGRALKTCPVCKRVIVIPPSVTCSMKCSRTLLRGAPAKRITRKCRGCHEILTFYANSDRAHRDRVFCSRQCRTTFEEKHGRRKAASRPFAKITDRADYGNRLLAWRHENGHSATNLSALAGVPSTSINRVESGESGLCQLYYERIGNITGVW